MNKTCHRFFGGRITAQERWLNKMAAEGWRLVRTGQSSYEFEPAEPGAVQYRVEFIAHKSRQHAEEYKAFLEGLGYRTFYKNINWHYSAGKVVARPWAEKGARLATKATMLDRELLIVERVSDGTPFELYTTYEDRITMYRAVQQPWLFFGLAFAGAGALARIWALCAVGLAALVPVLLYQAKIFALRRAARVREWDEGTGPRKE